MSDLDLKNPPKRFWRKPLSGPKAPSLRVTIQIIRERCKGCGFCIEFCPKQVLEWTGAFNAKGYHLPEVKDASACVDCNLCEVICPEFAVFTLCEDEGEPAEKAE